MAHYYIFLDDEVYGPYDYGYISDLNLKEYSGVFICNDRDEEWYEAKDFVFDEDDVRNANGVIDDGYIDEFGQLIKNRSTSQAALSVPSGYHIDEFGQVIRDTPLHTTSSTSSTQSTSTVSSSNDDSSCLVWFVIVGVIILLAFIL